MKRKGNLYKKIINFDNLSLANEKARKGKRNTYGVKLFNTNPEGKLMLLQETLINKNYKTSEYDIFTVFEPKERLVYRLPYYPDRIAHHAIMNILEPIFVANFTADTYSCIKGKGIHKCAYALKKALQDQPNTIYCLKIDITKFYPSIDHAVLQKLLRRKFKDKDLLWLLDEIIQSAPGLPIGNYLSQYLANFYMSGFDHWIKEQKAVKYYFRYADDIVILAPNKGYLHQLLSEIKTYLKTELRLNVKENYQVFPVESRGIDFIGYKFYHTHTLLRKQIKKNFAKMLQNNPNEASIASYMGWASHCDSKNLIKTLLPNESI